MVKIAVLSDIHGNIAALDAVLADAAARGVDQIVNLGDICSGGLFPQETADRLMPLNLPTIRGNHERQLFGSPDRMGLSDRHALATLHPEQLAWLGALPATLRLSKDVLLVHGTVDSDLTYLLETVTPEGMRPATHAEMLERAGTTDAALTLCGHTHVQRAVTLNDGRMIVNPGSVGLPAYDDSHPYPHVVESGSPHARYAIVQKDTGSSDTGSGPVARWSVDLISVAYDWEQAAQHAEMNHRPDWARALRTGRV